MSVKDIKKLSDGYTNEYKLMVSCPRTKPERIKRTKDIILTCITSGGSRISKVGGLKWD